MKDKKMLKDKDIEITLTLESIQWLFDEEKKYRKIEEGESSWSCWR